jgi:hypothetical protein
MKKAIIKLHEVLNLLKGFEAGYGSDSLSQGKMLIEYEGKRFVLELREIPNPSENIFDDIRNLKYY